MLQDGKGCEGHSLPWGLRATRDPVLLPIWIADVPAKTLI